MALWLWNDPFDFPRSSRLWDQHFGDDFITPLVPQEFRNLLRCPAYFNCTTPQDTASVNFDKDKFQANLDVQQFRPEEITVKAADNTITIEGKHEEKRDEHGYISRHFVRKYVLPEGHDINRVESKLSSDGVLTITAPKIEGKDEGRSIPIVQTGQPSKAVEQKKDEGKKEE